MLLEVEGVTVESLGGGDGMIPGIFPSIGLNSSMEARQAQQKKGIGIYKDTNPIAHRML